MLVEFYCSDDYDNPYKYKSKVHKYPDNTDPDKIMFDSGVWTIDVAEQLSKYYDCIVCWTYKVIEKDMLDSLNSGISETQF